MSFVFSSHWWLPVEVKTSFRSLLHFKGTKRLHLNPPYKKVWQNWCLLLFQHGRILFICEPNGDHPSSALWDHCFVPFVPHLSFTWCSPVWECFLWGSLLVRAMLQAKELLLEWERALVTELHADQKRTIPYFLSFSVSFISSTLFRVTDGQLLPCLTLSCWRLYVPLFWHRIPLFISVPIREWVLREDRLCMSGFPEEELYISECKL